MRVTYHTAAAAGLFALVVMAGCSTPQVSPGGTGAGGPLQGATASPTVGSAATAAPAAGPADGALAPPANPSPPVTSGATVPRGTTRQGDNLEEDLGNDVLVYVTNLAKSRPLENTEIRLGRSKFQPDVRRVMDRGTVGPLRAGSKATLVIFPDGPKGKKVSVAIRAPRSGSSDPRARILEVVLGDESVRVDGEMVSASSRGEHSRF